MQTEFLINSYVQYTVKSTPLHHNRLILFIALIYSQFKKIFILLEMVNTVNIKSIINEW